jgi:hypothetical protein
MMVREAPSYSNRYNISVGYILEILDTCNLKVLLKLDFLYAQLYEMFINMNCTLLGKIYAPQ